ncbi:unnamed protein product [Symbiodinium sp. CCMP2592]|nr:unnamed protein product [Symbiodinium sp. CCMP2592]
MSPSLELQAGSLQTPLEGPSLSSFHGMPSCNCEVSADLCYWRFGLGYKGLRCYQVFQKRPSTSVAVVQIRLWQSGAYQVPVLRGRIGTPLEISELKEHIPGFRWYKDQDDSDQALKLPVLENISSGARFEVSPAMSPEILDVQCRDASNATYSWSRITGGITRNGQAAFNLDPFSGLASGTPSLDLSAEGRGRLQINCGVALGGQLHDKVLPVAKLTVDVVDNMCWVPTNISGWFGWKDLPSKSACLALCREGADCAAVQIGSGTCRAVVSDGEKEPFSQQVLMRLENCSEEDTELNLTVKGAWYVQGACASSNVFQDRVSYSRAGATPELQIHLVQQEFVVANPKACENASWLLVHTNSSDFQNGSVDAPEFFGAAMACTSDDTKPLDTGMRILRWNFVFGTLEDLEHYSLHPCECFGESHANAAPVVESSSVQVPRSRGFNTGTVKDQLIFSGPYTCEDTAVLSQAFSTTLANCAALCRADATCAFYQLATVDDTCTLLERCDYIQQVDVQLTGELYGIPLKGDFCLIANPEQCWQQINRPELLESDTFECWQLPTLPVHQCSEYATKGIQKVPLPSEFPSASQIAVGCNSTSRMFGRLEESLKWEGPRPTTIFTCVSGQWVGELGSWQSLGNLSCQQCIQVGTPSLGNFSNFDIPEVYFLEHRLVQVTQASSSGQGCPTASWQTRSPLVLQLEGHDGQRLLRASPRFENLVLKPTCSEAEEETLFWQDASTMQERCLQLRHDSLSLVDCGADTLRLERQKLLADAGYIRVEAEANGSQVKAAFARCSVRLRSPLFLIFAVSVNL